WRNSAAQKVFPRRAITAGESGWGAIRKGRSGASPRRPRCLERGGSSQFPFVCATEKENRMTHQQQSTAIQHVVQVLAEKGFEGMAHAIEILLNEAMKLERAQSAVSGQRSAISSQLWEVKELAVEVDSM